MGGEDANLRPVSPGSFMPVHKVYWNVRIELLVNYAPKTAEFLPVHKVFWNIRIELLVNYAPKTAEFFGIVRAIG